MSGYLVRDIPYTALLSVVVLLLNDVFVAVLIGLVGAVLGGAVGVVVTFLTTRANMLLGLRHEYDRALRDKRLEHYQALFHVSGAITRNWLLVPEPTAADMLKIRQDLHEWYYGPNAPGMFLSPSAKMAFVSLVHAIEAAALRGGGIASSGPSPLAEDDLVQIRHLMSELRHQLAEDVGASHPPHLRWTRPPR